MHIRPKDYIVTEENLYFAAVSDYLEQDRALTFLRYKSNGHVLQKLETDEAAELIKYQYPGYLFYSRYADIELHGIPTDLIHHIYRPEDTVDNLLALTKPDPKQEDALNIIKQLINAGIEKEYIGITGSIMLETHNEHSDIDMVIYGRDNFFRVRQLIKQKISNNELGILDETLWKDAYQRRGCDLDFEEYCTHEFKKYNKCLSGSSKVDISMIPFSEEKYIEQGPYKKIKRDKISGKVLDDTYVYDFPARYLIDNNNIDEVVSYTATYTGQATQGDMIEAAGYMEQGVNGHKRLVVGTSREAKNEYIKIINV